MLEIVRQICFRSFRRAGRHRPTFWCEPLRTDGSSRKRGRKPICEGAVRAWPAQASKPFQVPGTHGRTARSTVVHLAFGPLTVLPPREDQTLPQRSAGNVGYPGVGRAYPSRRRTPGMDEARLGPHYNARAGMPGASGGMSTALSWKTITSVSKPDAVSKSARCKAPIV
jgi:hypothetical protein